MKFSMFIHPPKPTPCSTIDRPDRVAKPRPEVWRRMALFIESFPDESSARPTTARFLIGPRLSRSSSECRWNAAEC